MTDRRPLPQRPHIRYLLLHAYGRGGTIRTVMNQANSLVAAGWTVEIVSALRRRDDIQFPLDPRVGVSTVVDLREGAHTPPSGLVARWRDRRRGELLEAPAGPVRPSGRRPAQGLTGVDDPYEPPADPALVLPTQNRTPDESAASVYALLADRGLV